MSTLSEDKEHPGELKPGEGQECGDVCRGSAAAHSQGASAGGGGQAGAREMLGQAAVQGAPVPSQRSG